MIRPDPFDWLLPDAAPDAAPDGVPQGRAGGRAAAGLGELSPLARTTVLALRLWCDGGPAALAALQPDGAARAFDRLFRLLLTDRPAPFLRHATACPCLGRDEALLARLVSEAALGSREAALSVAFAQVRADRAPALVAAAAEAGLQAARALLRGRTGDTGHRPAGVRLH